MGTKRGPYKPIDLDQAEQLAAQGLTFQEIAICLDVCTKTLERRRREMSELSMAIKKGSAKGHAEVSNKLFTEAMGGNITAMIFYLKARCGWTDHPPPGLVIQNGTADNPIKIYIPDNTRGGEWKPPE